MREKEKERETLCSDEDVARGRVAFRRQKKRDRERKGESRVRAMMTRTIRGRGIDRGKSRLA